MSKYLPPNWSWVKLGDVCNTSSGGTPSRGNSAYYNGNIPWVKSGELDKGIILDTEEKISYEALQNSSAKLFPKGTLLIALYGATIGKLAFLGIEAATNQAVCGIFKNENINSDFLFNFLFFKKQYLVKQSIGGAQPNISQGILKNLDIPLPPLQEQKKIVEKIEELFSGLDNGVASLKKAKEQLRLYRQSVLAAAFSGKLTSDKAPIVDGEINNEQLIIKNEKQKNNSSLFILNSSLPHGWKWVKLGDLGTIGTGVTPLRSRTEYYNNGTIPWLTSSVVNDQFVYSADQFISNRAQEECRLKLYPKNTLLVALYGEGKTRGKCTQLMFESTINQAMAAIVLDKKHTGSLKYIKWFLIKNYEDMRLLSSGGVQPNLNLTLVKNTNVPFPFLSEQTQIVEEIEKRFSEADNLEKAIDESLAKSETLRQSILKQAFEGKLI